MSNLVQTAYIIDRLMDTLAFTRGNAAMTIIRAIRAGDLKVYKKELKYGTRYIRLYEIDEANRWLKSFIERRNSS